MSARPFLLAVCSSALACLGLSGCGDEDTGGASLRGARSLVLVTLDTTNAGALDLYGKNRGVTPRLAALGGEAQVFDAARSAALEQAGDQHDADIAVLRSSLGSLIEKVRALETVESDEGQLTFHRRIDEEFMEDIDTFVEARESMIPRLGMQRYADIMSPFANGERLLNRAWSASADGHVDEVQSCVATARLELEKAAEQLANA